MSEQREKSSPRMEEVSTPALGQELDNPQLEPRGEEPPAFEPVGFFCLFVFGRCSLGGRESAAQREGSQRLESVPAEERQKGTAYGRQ